MKSSDGEIVPHEDEMFKEHSIIELNFGVEEGKRVGKRRISFQRIISGIGCVAAMARGDAG